jgi:hypothetical protein
LIEFNEKIVAVWYISLVPNKQDWMAALSEIKPDEKYKLVYRFRYYMDGKIFDSDDKRNWYAGEATGTRAYCLAALRNVAQELADTAEQKVYETLNNGDFEDFLRRFESQPYTFVRLEGKHATGDTKGM